MTPEMAVSGAEPLSGDRRKWSKTFTPPSDTHLHLTKKASLVEAVFKVILLNLDIFDIQININE